MANSASGIFAILCVDNLEKSALNSCCNIGVNKRYERTLYVDDTLILTSSRDQTLDIQIETERSKEVNGTRNLSLLHFNVQIDNKCNFFFKNGAKRDIFFHLSSAMPFKTKIACIRCEIKRITDQCLEEKTWDHEIKNFEKLRNTYIYPLNTMKTANRRPLQHRIRCKEDSVFFNFPFFNDPTHWKVKENIQRSGIAGQIIQYEYHT